MLIIFSFNSGDLISRVIDGEDEFIEFEFDYAGLMVLGYLEPEDHKESNDGRCGIDDELPGIGPMKEGSSSDPDEHSEEYDQARPGGPGQSSCALRDMEESIEHFGLTHWYDILAINQDPIRLEKPPRHFSTIVIFWVDQARVKRPIYFGI